MIYFLLLILSQFAVAYLGLKVNSVRIRKQPLTKPDQLMFCFGVALIGFILILIIGF